MVLEVSADPGRRCGSAGISWGVIGIGGESRSGGVCRPVEEVRFRKMLKFMRSELDLTEGTEAEGSEVELCVVGVRVGRGIE